MKNKAVLHPFITILLISVLVQISLAQLPRQVVNYLATRETRYHHFLFHNVRNLWNDLDRATQNRIRDLGWAPPRPALRYDSSGSSSRIGDNASGEDFLFMHRQMIARVNGMLRRINPSRRLQGWSSIPAPGSRAFPVPRVYTIRGSQNANRNRLISSWKSNSFYWNTIKPEEDVLNDPDFLRSVSLGELGSRIEFRIHSWLHIRFSARHSRMRDQSYGSMEYIDKSWDIPSYNWLVDTFSSHVNPIFYRIHVWIDNMVEKWRRANNIRTIRWRGTWTGGPMSRVGFLVNGNGNNNNNNNNNNNGNRILEQKHQCHDMSAMEEVAGLLLKTGKCTFFYCFAEKK